jgi:adenine phosphoribosyltransferase
MSELKTHIRNIPDFPKEGIGFKDITTLLKDPEAFKRSVDVMAEQYADKNIDKIVGIESRGFIFGAALAYKLGVGFIPVRKPGKLPADTLSEEYELEYGTDRIEIHRDAVSAGEDVLLVDDLLATGGTAEATVRLLEKLDARIQGVAFLIELTFLDGRRRLSSYPVTSIIQFESE